MKNGNYPQLYSSIQGLYIASISCTQGGLQERRAADPGSYNPGEIYRSGMPLVKGATTTEVWQRMQITTGSPGAVRVR
jgi:hypothetical protein